MPIANDPHLQFQELALGLRARRQQVLASNIANATTPHYKARDLDFAAALQSAQSGRAASGMAKTSERHLSGVAGGSSAEAAMRYRVPLQPSIDGNTVDMDVERTQFAENAVRYEASLSFMNSLLRKRIDALQPVR